MDSIITNAGGKIIMSAGGGIIAPIPSGYDYANGIQYAMAVRKNSNDVGYVNCTPGTMGLLIAPCVWKSQGFLKFGDAQYDFWKNRIWKGAGGWTEDDIIIVYPVQYCPVSGVFQGQWLANFHETWTQTGNIDCNWGAINEKLAAAVCLLPSGDQSITFKYSYTTAAHPLAFNATEAPHPYTTSAPSKIPAYYPMNEAAIKSEVIQSQLLWGIFLHSFFSPSNGYAHTLTVSFTEDNDMPDYTIGIGAGDISWPQSTCYRPDSEADIMCYSLGRSIICQLGDVLVGLQGSFKDVKTVMINPIRNGLDSAFEPEAPYTIGDIGASPTMKVGLKGKYPTACPCPIVCSCCTIYEAKLPANSSCCVNYDGKVQKIMWDETSRLALLSGPGGWYGTGHDLNYVLKVYPGGTCAMPTGTPVETAGTNGDYSLSLECIYGRWRLSMQTPLVLYISDGSVYKNISLLSPCPDGEYYGSSGMMNVYKTKPCVPICCPPSPCTDYPLSYSLVVAGFSCSDANISTTITKGDNCIWTKTSAGWTWELTCVDSVWTFTIKNAGDVWIGQGPNYAPTGVFTQVYCDTASCTTCGTVTISAIP